MEDGGGSSSLLVVSKCNPSPDGQTTSKQQHLIVLSLESYLILLSSYHYLIISHLIWSPSANFTTTHNLISPYLIIRYFQV